MRQTVDVLLGAQWGDEGKGKVVDVVAPDYQVIARFQGGPNAGHTLFFEGQKHVLHTIPSGVFRPGTKNLVGNGVVIDPVIFLRELKGLEKAGVDTSEAILLARRANLILPTHRALDAASEAEKGKAKIGSTLKGIGPTYMDKTGRNGLRVGDIESPDFEVLYDGLKRKHERLLGLYGDLPDLREAEEEWMDAVRQLEYIPRVDCEHYLHEAMHVGCRILAEGAQGTLLDIDYGTYPFVTSSNTIAAGACTGLGIPPSRIGRVIGIFKAYCTRVGSGPFPTELRDDVGERMRNAGHEFGSTTGRPRRCGWLDLPALRYAVMVNGISELAMMKADVLDGFEGVKVCVGYKINGSTTDKMPYQLSDEVKPVYEELSGWESSVEVDENFVAYIKYIEGAVGVPVTLVSTGPDREQLYVPEQSVLHGNGSMLEFGNHQSANGRRPI